VLSALGQTTSPNLLEEGKKDPRAGGQQGRDQAGQGGLSFAPKFPGPQTATAMLPVFNQCCHGAKQNLALISLSRLLRHTLSDLHLGLDVDSFQSGKIPTLHPPPPKSPSYVSMLKNA